jgi:hypothetical protein
MKIQKIHSKIKEFIKKNNFLLQIDNLDTYLGEEGPTDFSYYVEKSKNIKDKKVLGLLLWIIWLDLPTDHNSRWPGVAAISMYSARKTGKEEDIVIRESKVTLTGEDNMPDDIALKDLKRINKEIKLISEFIDTLNIPSFKNNPAEGLNPGKKYNECYITDIPQEYRGPYDDKAMSIRVNKSNGKGYRLHYLTETNKKHNEVSTFFYDFKTNKAYDSVEDESDLPWSEYSSFMR